MKRPTMRSGRGWSLPAQKTRRVRAAQAGTVLAVTQLSGGGWGVLIEHDDGLESVCAYLKEPEVNAGARVERGEVIACSEAGHVYFEARDAGELIDPAELLGL